MCGCVAAHPQHNDGRIPSSNPTSDSLSDEKNGYTGLLCGECQPSFFRDTVTGTCKKCNSSPLLVWSIVIAVIAVLAYPVYRCHQWATEKGYLGGGDKTMVDNCTTVFFVSTFVKKKFYI